MVGDPFKDTSGPSLNILLETDGDSISGVCSRYFLKVGRFPYRDESRVLLSRNPVDLRAYNNPDRRSLVESIRSKT